MISRNQERIIPEMYHPGKTYINLVRCDIGGDRRSLKVRKKALLIFHSYSLW
jgi:hypothetical protein